MAVSNFDVEESAISRSVSSQGDWKQFNLTNETPKYENWRVIDPY